MQSKFRMTNNQLSQSVKGLDCLEGVYLVVLGIISFNLCFEVCAEIDQ